MERFARIGSAWIAACLGAGLLTVLPNWSPDTDLERVAVAVGVLLFVIGVVGILAEIVSWIRNRGKPKATPDQITVNVGEGGIYNSGGTVVVVQSREDAPPPPPTQSDGPIAIPQPDGTLLIPRVIRNHHFRITEIPLGANKVVGQEFEDCYIEGPAFLAPAGGNTFEECYFIAVGDSESILWQVNEDRYVVGVLQLKDCRFTRCTFRDIGIIGNKNTLDAFRASNRVTDQPPPDRGLGAAP